MVRIMPRQARFGPPDCLAPRASTPARPSRENSIAAAQSNMLIPRRLAGMIRPNICGRWIGFGAMRRPVVGVIGNAYRIENRFATQMVGERNLRAVAEVSGALPLMFAGCPDITDIGALLDTVDGVVLTGARANVHPTRFGTEPDPRHEPYDIKRDDLE